MYIVIFEDGDMAHLEQINDELLRDADDGIIDLIDINDPSHPLRYFDEGWCSLDVANTQPSECPRDASCSTAEVAHELRELAVYVAKKYGTGAVSMRVNDAALKLEQLTPRFAAAESSPKHFLRMGRI